MSSLGTFLGSVWWLIVSLGVLVTIHEFGHFWVARRCGIKVLRFSVGFGKPLWSRYDRHGTQYAIAAIPLGGYVKMLDERESPVADAELAQAFNRKSVWQRIAVVAAGPIANLLLCVALLWAMFVVGRPDFTPVVGQAEGIAAAAGLRAGDTLLEVDGQHTPSWSEASLALLAAGLDRADIALVVRTAEGNEARRTLRLSQLPAQFDDPQAIQLMGLTPRHQLLPPLIGSVVAESAAAGVLAPDDKVLAVDGERVAWFDEIGPRLQAAMAEGETEIMVEVERAGERLALPVRPQRRSEADGSTTWLLGIAPKLAAAPAYNATRHYRPVAAVPAALRETGRLFSESVAMIKRMLTGSASVRNVSGPITIARYANASAGEGAAWFLNFLALMSLSLAIINLLPIPLLDGGHLLYYLIELVKGSPLSERAMAAGQYLGLALLAGLMGLAFYNDVLGLVR